MNGLVTFRVCKLCSDRTHSVSVFQYRLVKHELCGLHSSPLVLFKNFTLVTLKDKVNTIYMVWQIKIL